MRKLTPGALNAMMPSQDSASRWCSGCGLTLPSYPGRYPSMCPDCGSGLSSRGSDIDSPEIEVTESLNESIDRHGLDWAVSEIIDGQDPNRVADGLIEYIIAGPQDCVGVMDDNVKAEIKHRLKTKGHMNGFPEPVHREDLTPSKSRSVKNSKFFQYESF